MNTLKRISIWSSEALLVVICIILTVLGFTAPNIIGLVPFAFNSVRVCSELKGNKKKNVLLCFACSFISSYGGGLLRDLFLNRTPSLFTNYFGPPITFIATLIAIVYFYSNEENETLETIMLYGEYYGLITFVADGYEITKDHGYKSIITLIVCSLLSGCGGGLIATIMLFRCHPKKVYGTVNYIGETTICGILLAIFHKFPYDLRYFVVFIIYYYHLIYSQKMLLYMESIDLEKAFILPHPDIMDATLKNSLTVQRYFIEYLNRLEKILQICLSKLKAKRKQFFYYRSAVKDF